jgi:hypothetical protein
MKALDPASTGDGSGVRSQVFWATSTASYPPLTEVLD